MARGGAHGDNGIIGHAGQAHKVVPANRSDSFRFHLGARFPYFNRRKPLKSAANKKGRLLRAALKVEEPVA
jgi:hypothetical protein